MRQKIDWFYLVIPLLFVFFFCLLTGQHAKKSVRPAFLSGAFCLESVYMGDGK